MLASHTIAAVPVAQRLTVGGAEAPGSRDDGECGAAVDRAEVVLHVGRHVGVRRAEGRLAGSGGVRREADEGDVRDDGAAAQRRRPGKETETRRHSQSPGASVTACHPCLSHLSPLPTGRSWSTRWEKPPFLAYAEPEASAMFLWTHSHIALN